MVHLRDDLLVLFLRSQFVVIMPRLHPLKPVKCLLRQVNLRHAFESLRLRTRALLCVTAAGRDPDRPDVATALVPHLLALPADEAVTGMFDSLLLAACRDALAGVQRKQVRQCKPNS